MMNRRQFMGACTAALGACVLARPAPADEEARWRKSLYVMDTWFWEADNANEMDVPAQVALVKQLGFGGLALSWGAKHAERLASLKEAGLETPGIYVTAGIDAGTYPAHLKQCIEFMKGTGGLIWLALTAQKHRRSDPAGDDAALALVKQCADGCMAAGLPGVALYPHVGFWMEKVADAARVAKQADRPDVGVQFNQFHWMAADGGKELRKTLEDAAPHLKGVSVNGSAAAAPSILPLGEGDYDVRPILQALAELGYKGPVSHQGYSIKGDLPRRLAAAKAAWDDLVARAPRP